MSIKTVNQPHSYDLTEELAKALKVGVFAIKNRDRLSTVHVKHYGLPSDVSNQVLRKYGRDLDCKWITNPVLVIPGRCFKAHPEDSTKIKCKIREYSHLILDKPYLAYTKINQVELDQHTAHIAVTVPDAELNKEPKGFIGVDVNILGHIAVTSASDGTVRMYGKSALSIQTQAKRNSAKHQSKRKYKIANKIQNKARRRVCDLNHKMSRAIVREALAKGYAIRLEDLTHIRETGKTHVSFKGKLHSWPFYQLQQMIEYKARIAGVPVEYVNPAFTSQDCSKCHERGVRKDKVFKCQNEECLYECHADVNAAHNVRDDSGAKFENKVKSTTARKNEKVQAAREPRKDPYKRKEKEEQEQVMKTTVVRNAICEVTGKTVERSPALETIPELDARSTRAEHVARVGVTGTPRRKRTTLPIPRPKRITRPSQKSPPRFAREV